MICFTAYRQVPPPESPAEKVRVVTQDYFEWVVDDNQQPVAEESTF